MVEIRDRSTPFDDSLHKMAANWEMIHCCPFHISQQGLLRGILTSLTAYYMYIFCCNVYWGILHLKCAQSMGFNFQVIKIVNPFPGIERISKKYNQLHILIKKWNLVLRILCVLLYSWIAVYSRNPNLKFKNWFVNSDTALSN